MKATDALVLNLEEVRRRSVKLWIAIPADRLHWRPDDAAMSCDEMVRHVLEGEYLYTLMLKSGASLGSDESPFAGRTALHVGRGRARLRRALPPGDVGASALLLARRFEGEESGQV